MKNPWLIGAIGYPCMELIFRKRTHISMALAGALGCAAICRCARGKGGWIRRSLGGACAVTAIEFLIGCLMNRRHHIWDYRKEKYHLLGQICPRFFLVWWGLSAAVMALGNHRLFRK